MSSVSNNNAINRDFLTAAYQGNTEAMHLCLSRRRNPASIDARDEDGKILDEADQWNEKSSTSTSRNSTALHFTCSYGHQDATIFLIERAPSLIHAVNNGGDTPLFELLRTANITENCFRKFLEYGAQLDFVGWGKLTIFHLLAGKEDSSLLRIALEHLKATKLMKERLLQIFNEALESLPKQLNSIIVEYSYIPTDSTVINWQNRFEKFSPLHYAIMWKRLEAVILLVAAGADQTVCDFQGRTPLAFAKKEFPEAIPHFSSDT